MQGILRWSLREFIKIKTDDAFSHFSRNHSNNYSRNFSETSPEFFFEFFYRFYGVPPGFPFVIPMWISFVIPSEIFAEIILKVQAINSTGSNARIPKAICSEIPPVRTPDIPHIFFFSNSYVDFSGNFIWNPNQGCFGDFNRNSFNDYFRNYFIFLGIPPGMSQKVATRTPSEIA